MNLDDHTLHNKCRKTQSCLQGEMTRVYVIIASAMCRYACLAPWLCTYYIGSQIQFWDLFISTATLPLKG